MPESSPHSLVPPLSKRHKISAPQADFSPLARFLPLAFLGMTWTGIYLSNTEGMDLVNHWWKHLHWRHVVSPFFFPNTTSSKVDMSAHGAGSRHTFTAWTGLTIGGSICVGGMLFSPCFFPQYCTAPSKVDTSAHGARSQHTFTARTWLESSILNPSTSYVWQAIFVKSTQTSVLSNLSLPP